jgi:hypothetical protein
MTIVQSDLIPGRGDELLTYDTQTHLEWLNLTASLNQSYIAIQWGFGGFVLMGFRFATSAQVSGLYKNAGISKLGGPSPLVDPDNDAGIEVLLDLMGGQAFSNPMESAQGMVNAGVITDRRTPIDVYGIFLNRTTSPVSNFGRAGYADSGYKVWHAGDRAPNVGAYLVRKRNIYRLPIPSSIKKKRKTK